MNNMPSYREVRLPATVQSNITNYAKRFGFDEEQTRAVRQLARQAFAQGTRSTEYY